MCVPFESNLFVNPRSGFLGTLTLLTTLKNFNKCFFFFYMVFAGMFLFVFATSTVLQVS